MFFRSKKVTKTLSSANSNSGVDMSKPYNHMKIAINRGNPPVHPCHSGSNTPNECSIRALPSMKGLHIRCQSHSCHTKTTTSAGDASPTATSQPRMNESDATQSSTGKQTGGGGIGSPKKFFSQLKKKSSSLVHAPSNAWKRRKRAKESRQAQAIADKAPSKEDFAVNGIALMDGLKAMHDGSLMGMALRQDGGIEWTHLFLSKDNNHLQTNSSNVPCHSNVSTPFPTIEEEKSLSEESESRSSMTPQPIPLTAASSASHSTQTNPSPSPQLAATPSCTKGSLKTLLCLDDIRSISMAEDSTEGMHMINDISSKFARYFQNLSIADGLAKLAFVIEIDSFESKKSSEFILFICDSNKSRYIWEQSLEYLCFNAQIAISSRRHEIKSIPLLYHEKAMHVIGSSSNPDTKKSNKIMGGSSILDVLNDSSSSHLRFILNEYRRSQRLIKQLAPFINHFCILSTEMHMSLLMSFNMVQNEMKEMDSLLSKAQNNLNSLVPDEIKSFRSIYKSISAHVAAILLQCEYLQTNLDLGLRAH